MTNEQRDRAIYLLAKHEEIERQLEDCDDAEFFVLNIIQYQNLEDMRMFLEARKVGEE